MLNNRETCLQVEEKQSRVREGFKRYSWGSLQSALAAECACAVRFTGKGLHQQLLHQDFYSPSGLKVLSEFCIMKTWIRKQWQFVSVQCRLCILQINGVLGIRTLLLTSKMKILSRSTLLLKFQVKFKIDPYNWACKQYSVGTLFAQEVRFNSIGGPLVNTCARDGRERTAEEGLRRDLSAMEHEHGSIFLLRYQARHVTYRMVSILHR